MMIRAVLKKMKQYVRTESADGLEANSSNPGTVLKQEVVTEKMTFE